MFTSRIARKGGTSVPDATLELARPADHEPVTEPSLDPLPHRGLLALVPPDGGEVVRLKRRLAEAEHALTVEIHGRNTAEREAGMLRETLEEASAVIEAVQGRVGASVTDHVDFSDDPLPLDARLVDRAPGDPRSPLEGNFRPLPGDRGEDYLRPGDTLDLVEVSA